MWAESVNDHVNGQHWNLGTFSLAIALAGSSRLSAHSRSDINEYLPRDVGPVRIKIKGLNLGNPYKMNL
jgi:hypothetical protein